MQLPRTRRLQRFASWIASFAILLAAVAPAVSQAMVAAGWGGADWVEVCTPQGMQWVSVEQSTGDKHGGDHSNASINGACAYCFTHAGSFGLPPTLGAVFEEIDSPREARLAFSLPPVRADRPWSAHLTRAPPYFA